MSQNQEIIEAKLCAFIDGDLDAEGRVEIEKHLEANPQHRRLLESLKATRDLIKWLPREAAPAEVAETLNGQLERSVLLDDDSDFLRPNIWPRVMAAAAIVLLTAGLGLAVYFTLPKSQKNATPYALRPGDSAQGPEAPTNEVDKAEESSARRESQPKVMSKGGTSGAEVMTKSDLMSKAKDANDEAGELARWAKRVDENRDAIAAVATGAQNQIQTNISQTAPPMASNAVVMLVRTSAPQDTRRQVTSFLDSQKIQWKETPASGQTEYSQQARRMMDANQGQALQQMEKQAPSQTAQLATQQSTQQIQQTTQQAQVIVGPTNSANLAATTASADASSQNNPTTRQAPFGAGLAGDRFASERGMYVARMSRQQAVSLGNTIAQEPAQRAEWKDMSGTSMTLAELGAGRPYSYLNGATTDQSPSQNQQNQQNQMFHDRLLGQRAGGNGFGGGGGGGRGFAQSSAKAPGATPPGANPPSANSPAPTTQPVDQQSLTAIQSQVPASQVAIPQTNPSDTAANQLADESVDVVIVVEQGVDPALFSPTSQPTSQPTSHPVSDVPATQPVGQ